MAGVSGAFGGVGGVAGGRGAGSADDLGCVPASPVRAATTVAVWAAAWQVGAPADEVLDALASVAHRAGVRAASAAVALRAGTAGPGQASGSDLDLLTLLRRGGRPGLLLPVPGDLRGLPVRGEILIPALDAGAVVTLPEVGVGLVPMHGQWRVFDCAATHPHPTIPARDAVRLLDDAIAEATRSLVSADLAVGSDTASAARTAIAARMRAEAVDLPAGSPPLASGLLARAISLDAMLSAAGTHRTAAVTSGELATVHDALGPLAAAAREARRTAVETAIGALLDDAPTGRG